MRICVYGSSQSKDSNTMDQAWKLGTMIARHGHSLTYGGFGQGLLAQTAYGVKQYNGHIMAVMPTKARKNNPTFPQIDQLLVSDDKRERKRLQVENADMFIVLPSGVGVMDELFEILVLKEYGILSQDIYLVNINGRYDTLIRLLQEEKAEYLLHVVNNVDEIKM